MITVSTLSPPDPFATATRAFAAQQGRVRAAAAAIADGTLTPEVATDLKLAELAAKANAAVLKADAAMDRKLLDILV